MKTEDNHLKEEGQLFIVATPIGNLGDMTYRAVSILQDVDLIAAEDTRVSSKLLSHYAISTPMLACHEHNEASAAKKIIAHLRAGSSVALISDAGTPLINDPGYRLVREVRKAGFIVTPVPGASSPIAALSASGLPTDQFTYAGFLPRSGRARSEFLSELEAATHTYLLLESPRRLVKTLEDLCSGNMSEREICVARELTKLHETFICGTLTEVTRYFQEHAPRGEIVLMIGPAAGREATDDELIRALSASEVAALPPSKRAGSVAKQFSVPKSRVYSLLLDLQR
ncbi:MAG: 16S rRNA (cytidine(1402)-2'-O)-methyltransferase [Mariprofundaceae bacterium]|nr:16S rRNA (cytidine(1402)-2'-O)-methyltransferase [Mariprofundaceae bacterium]